LLAMTVIFPFAGARGGFFHSGAAVQGLWWALAPLGLDTAVAAARRRGLFTPHAPMIFQASLVGLAILLSAVIVAVRVVPGWGEGEQDYPKIEALLDANGIRPGDVVMVRNPPGYYLMTGRAAIVIPYARRASILAAAARYHASYLVVEAAGAAGPIKDVYGNLGDPQLGYVGAVGETRIFKIQP
jgi:hypothetical protein